MSAVKDGLGHSELALWGTLSGRDDSERPTRDADPTRADGHLHWWGVGGTAAAVRLCGPRGRIRVTSCQPRAGCDKVVGELEMDLGLMSDRKAAGSGNEWFLPGDVRAPNDVELGRCDAPDGGRWDGAGTEVRCGPLNASFVADMLGPDGVSLSPAFVDRMCRQLTSIYYPYIAAEEGPQLPRCLFDPPPCMAADGAADGARPPAFKKQRLSCGEAGPSSAPPPPPPPRSRSGLRIFVQGVDLAKCDRKDVMSSIVRSVKLGYGEAFEVGLAISFDGGRVVSQARVAFMYAPYTDGRETRPKELGELRVEPMDSLLLRSGRMLQKDGKPATLALSDLLDWKNEAVRKEAKRFKLEERFLRRVVSICSLGFTFEPLPEKNDLKVGVHERALKCLFDSNSWPEGEDGHVVELYVTLRCFDNKHEVLKEEPWKKVLPDKDKRVSHATAVIRKALMEWISSSHSLYDKEYGPESVMGASTYTLQNLAEDEQSAFGLSRNMAATVWHFLRMPDRELEGGGWPRSATRAQYYLVPERVFNSNLKKQGHPACVLPLG